MVHSRSISITGWRLIVLTNLYHSIIVASEVWRLSRPPEICLSHYDETTFYWKTLSQKERLLSQREPVMLVGTSFSIFSYGVSLDIKKNGTSCELESQYIFKKDLDEYSCFFLISKKNNYNHNNHSLAVFHIWYPAL